MEGSRKFDEEKFIKRTYAAELETFVASLLTAKTFLIGGFFMGRGIGNFLCFTFQEFGIIRVLTKHYHST
jgi:hypothetical protein